MRARARGGELYQCTLQASNRLCADPRIVGGEGGVDVLENQAAKTKKLWL
jgi:hypothetical protein